FGGRLAARGYFGEEKGRMDKVGEAFCRGGEPILIVDDEPTIVEVVELYLLREGFKVLTAADGPAALAAVAQQQPDLVVLDLMLPGMSGLDLTRQIRAGGALPIIMLTARGEETDRVVGLELGADDYVPQPFSPRELIP